MAFELGKEVETIILPIEQGGEIEKTVHHLRVPNAQEYAEYQRRLSGIKGATRKLSFEFRRVDAAVWLYDKIIVNVENYTLRQKPITELTEEELRSLNVSHWKDLIPAWHKERVIDLLFGLTVFGLEEEIESPLE